MIQGYISASVGCWGILSNVDIVGIMNIDKYHQILIQHAIPCGTQLSPPSFVTTRHTANALKLYLDRKT